MTDDDAILKQLGARAREQQADTALPEGIPAFDAATEDRMAALLLKPDAKPEASPSAVIRPRRWLWAVAPPLAAAAAIALFVATRGGGGVSATPGYEVSVVSVTQLRAPSSAKTSDRDFEVDPDGELELIARPTAPVKEAHARAFLVGPGGAQPWLVPLDISEQGAVRISGTTRSLFPGTTGEYEIVLFIATGDTLPTDVDALRIARTTTSGDAPYRVVRSKVRFVEKK